MKKYHYVYQTKNLINGKTYIGVHSTNNLNDGYIGCGVRSQKMAVDYVKHRCTSPFINAVNKYGYDNFRLEILSFYGTRILAYEEEKYLVTKDWVSRGDNYNAVTGGDRGKMLPKLYKQRKKVISGFLNGESTYSLAKRYKCSVGAVRKVLEGVDRNERVKKKPLKEKRKIDLKNKIAKNKKIAIHKSGKSFKFDTYAEASRNTGIHEATIRRCIKTVYKSKDGWKFLFLKNYDSDRDYFSTPKTPSYANTKYSGIVVEHILGEKRIATNSYQLAKEIGCNESETRALLSGKRNMARFWYLEDSNKLKEHRKRYLRNLYCPNGDVHLLLDIFKYGISKFAKENNINPTNLSTLIGGRLNCLKGFYIKDDYGNV